MKENRQLDFWNSASEEVFRRRKNLFSRKTLLKDIQICAHYILEAYLLSHKIPEKIMDKFMDDVKEALECIAETKKEPTLALFYAIGRMQDRETSTARGRKVTMGIRQSPMKKCIIPFRKKQMTKFIEIPEFFSLSFISIHGTAGTFEWDRLERVSNAACEANDSLSFALQEKREFHFSTSRASAETLYYNGLSVLQKRHSEYEMGPKKKAVRPKKIAKLIAPKGAKFL